MNKTMEFRITLADNGYIIENDGVQSVYQAETPNYEMLREICSELIDQINYSDTCKFNVKIEVTPINEE